jgi:hypothetical protein
VRTLVVSDLHLATANRSDLLRIPAFQDRLFEQVQKVEQVVLLGDVVETREQPMVSAIAETRTFFKRLGKAGAGKRIVLVAGNHDHYLVKDWVDELRASTRNGGALALEQFANPDSGPIAEIASTLKRSGADEVVVAYPGLWLSDTVYATHGHYLDLHLTVPSFERLGIGVVQRVIGGQPAGPLTPDDYERILGPLYSLLHELAEGRAQPPAAAVNPSDRVLRAISREGGGAQRLRGLLLGGVALPAAVGVLNRLGLGRFRADLSLDEISRASLVAMHIAVLRLGIEASHVIFGHTHRRGPLPGDGGWEANGVQLHNTGSWVWSPTLAGARQGGPHWPGTIALIDDDGTPNLTHLLDELRRDEIEASLAEHRDSIED